jgi:hypothetical protein
MMPLLTSMWGVRNQQLQQNTIIEQRGEWMKNWGIGAAVKQWGWEPENTEEGNGSFFYTKIVVKSEEGVQRTANNQINRSE